MEREPDDVGAGAEPSAATAGFGADLLSAASSEAEAHSMTVTVADPRVSATRKKMGRTKSTSALSLPCPLPGVGSNRAARCARLPPLRPAPAPRSRC